MNRHRPSPENQNDLQELISAFIDGTLSETETQKFLARLESDEIIRDLYLQMMNTDSLLQWEQGQTESQPDLLGLTSEYQGVSTTIDSGVVLARKQLTFMRYALAATIAVCLCLAGLLLMESNPTLALAQLDSSEGVPAAMIIEEHHAIWEKTEWTQDVSKPLVPGWLKLKSGQVLIDFLGGTTIALQGPAELGLNANNRAYLKSGRLATMGTSRVHDFTLTTDNLTILSQSANFGLSVTSDNQTEVHVFEGRVTVSHSQSQPVKEIQTDKQPETADAIIVEAGQAILFDQNGQEISRQLADRIQFPSRNRFSVADPPGDIPAINFASYSIEPYGFQDGQYELPTDHQLIEQGKGIRLWGNAWKTLEINKEVTPNTVIEFDFRCSHEGQIHGFGFDTDQTHDKQNHVFQIYGYEVRPGIGQQFNTYTGTDWKRFRIRVGRYLAGKHRYLVFIADEDVIARAESQFRNVRIYEAPVK
ncbi:hypothetical protein [uncultured Gimesia sp.]|mgnify:CR=1 FL=1|uniref:anti-sigma factor family protein n=1 Tax=uncultured Gimesia sp. TaxID=1678688 RepID=UPI00260B6209|nr:hypothetical protein [uncultured Gimesia sp.]